MKKLRFLEALLSAALYLILFYLSGPGVGSRIGLALDVVCYIIAPLIVALSVVDIVLGRRKKESWPSLGFPIFCFIVGMIFILYVTVYFIIVLVSRVSVGY